MIDPKLREEAQIRAEIADWMSKRYDLDATHTMDNYESVAPGYGMSGAIDADIAKIRAHNEAYKGRVRSKHGGAVGDAFEWFYHRFIDAGNMAAEGFHSLVDNLYRDLPPTTTEVQEAEEEMFGFSPSREGRRDEFSDAELNLAWQRAYKGSLNQQIRKSAFFEGQRNAEQWFREFRQEEREFYEEIVSPAFRESFAGDLSGGAGTLLAMLPMGAMGIPGTVGLASMTYQEQRDDYFQTTGIDPDAATPSQLREARMAGLTYAPVGVALEKIGMGPIIKRIFKPGVKLTTREGMKRMTVALGEGAATEGTTEFAQTVSQNLIAIFRGYDPDREWDAGAWRAALAGAILGGGMTGTTQGLNEYSGRIEDRIEASGGKLTAQERENSRQTAAEFADSIGSAEATTTAQQQQAAQLDMLIRGGQAIQHPGTPVQSVDQVLTAGVTEPLTADEFRLLGVEMTDEQIKRTVDPDNVRAAFKEGNKEAQKAWNERHRLEPTAEMLEAQKSEEERQRELDEAEITLDGEPDAFGIRIKQASGVSSAEAIAASALFDATALDKSKIKLRRDGEADLTGLAELHQREVSAAAKFSFKLDEYLKGKLSRHEAIPLGDTPEAMQLADADPLPLVITQDAIAHAARDEDGHRIDPQSLRLLPMKMRRPLAIFQSATEPDGMAVVIDMDHAEGGKVMVAVHLNVRKGVAEINDIRSLYKRPTSQYEEWAKQGLLRYLDKKKAPGWAPVLLGVQFPQIRRLLSKADNKLATEDDLSQVRNEGDGQRKGKVNFLEDGTAVITVFDGGDISTIVHEMGHIARRWLINKSVSPDNRVGITDSDIDIIERWAGVKDGEWTRKAEEKFARGWERFMRDGKAPTPRLAKVFEALSQWLKQIYNRLAGSPVNVRISPEVRQVFDKLVTREQAMAALRKGDPAGLTGADRLMAMKAQGAPVDELFQAFDEEYRRLIDEANRDLRREEAAYEREFLTQDRPTAAERARQQRRDLREAIAELEAMIQQLPREVRGKITGFATLAKKVQPEAQRKYLEDRRERISKILNDHLMQQEREKVEKLVRDRLPKVKEGTLKGRSIDADASKTIQQINRALYLDEHELRIRLESLEAQAADNGDTMPVELAEEYHIFSVFGGLLTDSGKNEPLSKWRQARLDLENVINEGRTRWQAQEQERKVRMEEYRTEARKTISGGKPNKTTERHRQDRGGKRLTRRSLLEKLAAFDAHNSSFEWLLDNLSGRDRGSQQLDSFLNRRYVPMVHRATRMKSRFVREYTEMLDTKYREIYGSRQAARKATYDNGKVVDKTGVFTYDEKGHKLTEIPLSQEEAAKKWMEWQDKSLEATFDTMGWTEKTIQQLEKYLTPEMLKWAQWQLHDFYPRYHQRVNEVYREINGVDLPFNPNYSPIRRERGNAKTNDDLMREERVFGSVSNGSLKSRVANTRALAYEGASSTLMQHIQKMEHYIHFAEPMRELRSVLQSEEVATAIDQFHGDHYRGAVNHYLDNLARGGVDRAITIGAVDKFRSVATRGILALNFPVLVKQLTSIPAYAINIPATRHFKGISDALLNPVENLRPLYESDYFKERWGEGYDRDIRLAMSREDTRMSRWLNQLMIMTRLGDAGAVLVGGLGVYQYHRSRALEAGKSEKEANNIGLQEWEAETRRMQQSGDVQDLGLIAQRGSFAKLFTMFSTAPNAYYRAEMGVIRNMMRGRISKARALKQLAILHFVLPGLFQFVANGFSAGLGDEEGDEEKRERMLRAMLLGNANGILIIGDAFEALMNVIISGEAFGLSNPVLDMGTDIIQQGKDIRKTASEGNIGIEEILKMTDSALEAASLTVGIPYGNISNYIQGMSAAAEGRTEHPIMRSLGWSEYAVAGRDEE